MRRALALSFLLALLAAAPVAAQPYRWVDEDGSVHYGDQPPQPAPPTLENLNPNARPRRPDPSPAKAAPAQPAPVQAAPPPPAPPQPASEPTPAVAPSREVRSAPTRHAPQPVIEALPAPPEEGRVLVREVMELSGIDRYLEDVARSAQGDLARLAWSTREPSAAWAALAPVFRRDVMAAATAAALARRLENEHLPGLIAWLHSPEHRQLRQAELDAAKPANHRVYRQFVAALADPNAKLPHLSLVQQLERSGRGADRHLALERALRLSMRRAVAPLTVRVLDDEDEETSPRAEERTRFWLMTGTLFAYRGLGSAQIEAAVRFERSPAGVWFTTIAWESLEEAVRVVEQRATAAIKAVATRSLSPREPGAGTAAHR